MHVTIKYFAAVRETIGQAVERRETSALTVGGLREELLGTSTAHAEALAPARLVRMALNQVMCDDTVALAEGCEVAFFPPVTGG